MIVWKGKERERKKKGKGKKSMGISKERKAKGLKSSSWVRKKIYEEKKKGVVLEVRGAYFEYKDREKGEYERRKAKKIEEDWKRGIAWNETSEKALREELGKENEKRWKDYFPAYVKKIAPYFYVSRYHLFLMLMCQVAYERACLRGEAVVLSISCPPQTGKTEVVHMFATWLSMKYPDESVLMFSYGYVHASRIGRKMINIVDRVCGDFGLSLAKDRRAIVSFGYEGKRGGIESMGIDGTSTGVGGTFKFIDDPLKDDDEAGNNTIRDKKWEYIEDKVMTRSNVLANGGSITMYIMTRRHEDDPIGRLDKMWISKEMSADGFARKYSEYVRIPFVCDTEDGVDPLGRKLGEPLDPYAPKERGLGLDRAKYLQATISSRRWLAQYQQKPTLEDGDMVKREMFKIYEHLPKEFHKVVLSCDLSNEGGKKSDKTAFTLWGKYDENHYLIDFAEGKWSFSSQVAIISKYCELYPVNKILVEKRATGTATIDYMKSMLKINVPVVGFEPKFSSKEQRLATVEPYFSGGYVFIPSEKLNKKVESMYLNEMLSFPNGANDGLVDTTSQYLIDDSMIKGGKMVGDESSVKFYSKLGSLWRL